MIILVGRLVYVVDISLRVVLFIAFACPRVRPDLPRPALTCCTTVDLDPAAENLSLAPDSCRQAILRFPVPSSTWGNPEVGGGDSPMPRTYWVLLLLLLLLSLSLLLAKSLLSLLSVIYAESPFQEIPYGPWNSTP